eukprot:scaffold20640_cov124-Isochrysis_galbana.AAC.2
MRTPKIDQHNALHPAAYAPDEARAVLLSLACAQGGAEHGSSMVETNQCEFVRACTGALLPQSDEPVVRSNRVALPPSA